MHPPQPKPNLVRENDPNELERFKQSIDLTDYAVRQHGYQIQKEGPRGDWQQLTKGEETLIVSRKGDHKIYLNTGDDRDAGSVVDFAKTRGGNGEGLNLGQVRKELRQYLGEAENGPQQQPLASQTSSRPAQEAPQPQQQADERTERARLITEVLGVEKGLTDRTYLHSRGIKDETIDAPAFQGRVFTAQQNEHKNTAFPLYNEFGITSVEQKNHDFKNLLPGPKDGVWVSKPTDSPEKPLQRLEIGESGIDALSKYQLQHKGTGENTMYVATTGTPTERQTELIQRIIDKQEPKQIVLSNDNDAGGRRFNINYLNDLQPPRRAEEVEGHLTYKEASRPLEWHATQAGKYHTALRVEMRHDNAAQGAEFLKGLTEKVATLNSAQTEPAMTMEVVRNSPKETLVRIEAPNGEIRQLEAVAQQLYQQRELARPEQDRHPSNFIKMEYAVTKDYNHDLELVTKGMNAQQIQAQALLEQQQKEMERQQRQQQEEQQRQAKIEADKQAAAQAEKERQQNTPEAIEQRRKDDEMLGKVILGVAVAEVAKTAVEPNDPKNFDALHNVGVVLLQPGEHHKFDFTRADPNHPVFQRQPEEVERAPQFKGWRPDEPLELPVGPPVSLDVAREKAADAAYTTREMERLAGDGHPVPGTGGQSESAKQFLNQPAGTELVAPAPGATERYLVIVVEEAKPEREQGGQRAPDTRAEALAGQLEVDGAGVKATVLPSDKPDTVVTELRVAYSLQQSELDLVHRDIEAAKQQPGVRVLEDAGDRAARVDALATDYLKESGKSLPEFAQILSQEQALPAATREQIVQVHIQEMGTLRAAEEITPTPGEGGRSATAQVALQQQPGVALEVPPTSANPDEKVLLINVQGPPLAMGDSGNQLTKGEQLEVLLHQAGAGTQYTQIQPAKDDQPEQSQLRVAYSLQSPDLDAIHNTLAYVQQQQPGVQVVELQQDRLAREYKLVDDYQRVNGYSTQQELIATFTPEKAAATVAPSAPGEEVARPATMPAVQPVNELVNGYVLVQEPAKNTYSQSDDYAQAVRDRLQGLGAQVALQHQPEVNYAGVQESKIAFSYVKGSPQEETFARTLDALDRQPGVQVKEIGGAAQWQSFNEKYPAATVIEPGLVPERTIPLLQREADIQVRGEGTQASAEQLKAALEAQGVKVTPIVSDPKGFLDQPDHRMSIVYQLDSPNIEAISKTLQEAKSRPNGEVDVLGYANIERMRELTPTLVYNATALGAPSLELQQGGGGNSRPGQTVQETGTGQNQPGATSAAGGPGQPPPPGKDSATAEPEKSSTAEKQPLTPPAEVAPKQEVAEPVKAPAPEKNPTGMEPDPRGVEKLAIVKVDEVAPANGQTRGKAEAIHDHLGAAGAKVGDVKSTTDNNGIRHSEMQVSYRTDQPEIKEINKTLEIVGKANGVQLMENGGDRAERNAAAAKIPERAVPSRGAEIER